MGNDTKTENAVKPSISRWADLQYEQMEALGYVCVGCPSGCIVLGTVDGKYLVHCSKSEVEEAIEAKKFCEVRDT